MKRFSINKEVVLITGSEGFIGRHLGRHLDARGYEIIGISRCPPKLPFYKTYYQIDLLDVKSLKDIDGKIDHIIHLAAITERSEIIAAPDLSLRSAVVSTMNTLEILNRTCAKTLVFPSSGKVYGRPKYLPYNESHPLNPTTFLGKSKKIAEEIITYHAGYMEAVNTNILRIFNVYGPGQKDSFLIPSIIKGLTQGNVTVGDLTVKRDYIYITDLIRLIEIILHAPNNGYRVLNVGSGQSHSINDLIVSISRLYNTSPAIHEEKNKKRMDESPDEKADIKAALSLGWKPEISITEGLRITFDEEKKEKDFGFTNREGRIP